jgi:probable HAF family extracellular repeat protein
MKSYSFSVLTTCAIVYWCSVTLGSEFIPLGDLNGGSFLSFANAVSPDGSAECGNGTTAIPLFPLNSAVWKASTGMLPVFDISLDSFAQGVSNGGTTVVGSVVPKSGGAWAMIWHPGTGYSRLPGFEDTTVSGAMDISADGSVVVGRASNEAFRWTSATGRTYLGDLAGGDDSSGATAVSADGSVVVGYSDGTSGLEAFRWTNGDGMVGLGKLSTTDQSSYAESASDDGSVVVGRVQTNAGKSQSFRWTESTGMVGLGSLADFDQSDAAGVNGDGTVVVGIAHGPSGGGAFIWDQLHGMRNLQSTLINDYGLGQFLVRWTLREAADISSDGLTIVGDGINPDGYREAWLVRLDHPVTTPEPQTAALISLAAAAIAACQVRRRPQVAR